MPSLTFRRSPAAATFHSSNIARRVGTVMFDSLESDAAGLVRIIGWTLSAAPDLVPRLLLDVTPIPLLQQYRLARPDINESAAGGVPPGIVFEYLVPRSLRDCRFASISVFAGDTLLLKTAGPFVYLSNVHYDALLDTAKTFHRDEIYGSGLPNVVAHPETVALAKSLPGPTLDFGCGSGAMIKELRASGIEAFGIELDNEVIRPSLHAEAAPYITLYRGEFPTPFAKGEFRSVFCSEVLEHIPEFEAAVAEIARVATERAIFTVPDAAAIPLGFRHGLVPWHLLEGTHVNFFSQSSLGAVLQPHFRHITFGRVGASHMNETNYHVSLVAWCIK